MFITEFNRHKIMLINIIKHNRGKKKKWQNCTLLSMRMYSDERFTTMRRTFCRFAVIMKRKFWVKQRSSVLSAYKYSEQIHTNTSVKIQSEKTSVRLAWEHIRPVLGGHHRPQGRALAAVLAVCYGGTQCRRQSNGGVLKGIKDSRLASANSEEYTV